MTAEKYANPFKGQVIRDANLGESNWYEENVGPYRPVVKSPMKGTVVTSESFGNDTLMFQPSGVHKPVLDIDFPVVALESSTPGHSHLFIDKELTWDEYVKVLNVLAEVGIIEQGFVNASMSRKHTAVRLPWIKKEQVTE